jgi:hypothetical protein
MSRGLIWLTAGIIQSICALANVPGIREGRSLAIGSAIMCGTLAIVSFVIFIGYVLKEE